MSWQVTLDSWARARRRAEPTPEENLETQQRMYELVFGYYLRDLQQAAVDGQSMDGQLQLIATEMVQDGREFWKQQAATSREPLPTDCSFADDVVRSWFAYRNAVRLPH